MASNFKIFSQLNNGDLHLKLMGDFDGSSAYELLNTLHSHHGRVDHMVVHTDGLSSIHPFGLGIFHKNCSAKILARHLTFTGKYVDTIAP